MKILIVSGKPHLPQAVGGVPSCTHELALELIGRGHEVSVMCGLSTAGLTGFRVRASLKFSRHKFIRDSFQGYPVYRQWDVRANIGDAARMLKPDVAVIQLGELVPLTREFQSHSVPTVTYLHNVEVQGFGGDLSILKGSKFISNSAFTAHRIKELFDINSAIIPPLFRAEYYLSVRRAKNVTFINPIKIKGSELAFEIAKRCPDIPFCFVKTWSLDRAEEIRLEKDVAAIPNITLHARTRDMKSIYGNAKVMLVPSKWEETWGRVATEAQFNGIPVIAANRGGLPEAVGPGGVLLDPDGPVEPWVEAVRGLWSDAALYEIKRQAALGHARRPEIDPVRQTDALLAVLRAAISKMD